MLSLFKIKREERLPALILLTVLVVLNAMLIYKYFDLFTRGGNLGFWTLFRKNFCVSGFDAFSYIVLSNMRVHFVTARHPLFLTVLYPLYLLNDYLMSATGVNFAVFLMAALIIFCAFYSFIYMYRIFREVIGLGQNDATLLTTFFFSFAYIMLAAIVPDHFIISLFLLTMTLYIAGMKMKKDEKMSMKETFILFFLTAGITLTNGVKTFMASVFVNRRSALSPKRMFFSFVLPSVLLFGIYFYQHQEIEIPQQQAIRKIEQEHEKRGVNLAEKNRKREEWVKAHNGKTISDKPILEWTDISTSRMRTAVENLFGESFILHRQYLLQDVQETRPIFVPYDWAINYAVEFIIVILFACGAYFGRKSRFMQMCLVWFSFDMIMHLIAGFGINEVYIMTAHWAFIVPFSVAFMIKNKSEKASKAVRISVAVITAYLLIYNTFFISVYMLG